MGQALIIVNHEVNDYAAWRTGYENVQPLRDRHGVTTANVLQDPADPNKVTVLHWFPSVAQAQAFVDAPELHDAMQKAGVAGPPRIEITVEA